MTCCDLGLIGTLVLTLHILCIVLHKASADICELPRKQVTELMQISCYTTSDHQGAVTQISCII